MGMHRLIKTIEPKKIIVEPLNLPPEEIEVEIPKRVVEVEELQPLQEQLETYQTVNVAPIDVEVRDRFGPSWEPIDTLEKLKKVLEELYIRFNTEPHRYIKFDYKKLLDAISRSLIHLYKGDTGLAPIAYTGDVEDLVQHEYFILDCGSSTKNI